MALEAVQLEDRLKDKPNQLSGGQLRRVGLAQALVGEQPIVLLDEPTAGLDPAQKHVFRNLLTELGATRSFVVSTHDTSDVDSMYNRVVILHEGTLPMTDLPMNSSCMVRDLLTQQRRHFLMSWVYRSRRDDVASSAPTVLWRASCASNAAHVVVWGIWEPSGAFSY